VSKIWVSRAYSLASHKSFYNLDSVAIIGSTSLCMYLNLGMELVTI
jgi:hypothetical protein